MDNSLVIDNSPIVIRSCMPSDVAATVALYRTCFAEPPWFETFDPEELTREFNDMLTWPDIIFLVAKINGAMVGGFVGFDLERKADIVALLPAQADKRFYFSELFVAASVRNRHISQTLLRKCFALARERGYIESAVRTSINQPIIRLIFERLDFKIVATQEVESTKLVDGVRCAMPDQRIILTGKIP